MMPRMMSNPPQPAAPAPVRARQDARPAPAIVLSSAAVPDGAVAAEARQPTQASAFLVNFRHLRAFIAVAQLGSVTLAAEHLYRVKSAVTRSILELERALGVPLFERKATGMFCNTYGDALLARVVRALDEFDMGFNGVVTSRRDGATALDIRLPGDLFNEARLEAFVRLAECGNMHSVARQLGITQPAVSRSINALERSLGAALFRRTTRGMLATDTAQALFFRVKRALLELRQVEPDIAALKGTTEGSIVIGALPLGRTTILPRAIVQVLAAHPRLRISTVEGSYETLAAKLRTGDIDFIFGALRPADHAADLQGEPLLNDSLAVVVRGGHPFTRLARPTLATLAGATWVLPNSGTVNRQLLDLSFRLENLAPPVPAVETSDLALLRGILLGSDHVTLVSARQVAYELHAGLLAVLDIDLPNTTRVIGISRRADSDPSPGAAALMAEIRRVAAQPAH